MAKDLIVKASIDGGEIRAKAQLGQTAKVYVEHDQYRGQTEVTPSAETQVLETENLVVDGNITINPAPVEQLSVDPLSQSGIFSPADGKVGFSQVNVQEQWDGILLPPADGKAFYVKQVLMHVGDVLILDGHGYGGRLWAIRGGGGSQNRNNGFGASFGVLPQNGGVYMSVGVRYTTPPFIYDTLINIGGYEWRNDGERFDTGGSENIAYEFHGEYIKYKIVRAT